MTSQRDWKDSIRAMPPDKLKELVNSLQTLQNWGLFAKEFQGIEFIRDLVTDEILNREYWP